MINLLILSITTFIVFFFTHPSAAINNNNISYAQLDNDTTKDYKEFKDILIGIKFEYPSNWHLTSNTENVELSICGIENCSDGDVRIMVISLATEKQYTPEKFIRENLDKIKSIKYGTGGLLSTLIADTSISQPNKIKTSHGYDAIELTINETALQYFSMESGFWKNTTSNYIFIPEAINNDIYVISYESKPEKYEVNRPFFNHILDSFQIIGFE